MDDYRGAGFTASFPTHGWLLHLAAIGLLSFLLLLFGGCAPRVFHLSSQKSETSYTVNSKTKFTSGPVHIVGRASCPYILFSIPLCKHQDLASVAFKKMYQEAKIEGLSAQFVNVTHDAYLGTNVFHLFFVDHHAVSADVIVYEKISED